MNNLNQPITKGDAVKRFALILIGAVILAAGMFIIGHGEIPIKAFLISLAIIVPIMILSSVWGFKNREKVAQNTTYRNKLFYTFFILGVLSVIFHGCLILIGQNGLESYIGLGAGLIFIYYGFKLKRDAETT